MQKGFSAIGFKHPFEEAPQLPYFAEFLPVPPGVDADICAHPGMRMRFRVNAPYLVPKTYDLRWRAHGLGIASKVSGFRSLR